MKRYRMGVIFFSVILLALYILLGLNIMRGMAQDATAEPTPVVTPGGGSVTPIPIDEAGSILLNDVINIIASYGAIVGAAGAIIVGGLKFLPFFNNPDNISGATLNLLVNGVLAVLFMLATRLGFADQFQTGLTTVETVGRAILALISTVLGSAIIHRFSANEAVPVFGYQRPDARLSSQSVKLEYPLGE